MIHQVFTELTKKLSFGGDGSDNAPLLEREENIDEALARIKCKFPNFNPDNSPFTFRIDDYGRVMVRLKRDRGKYYPLFNADDKLNDKLPKKEYLGPPAEEIVETNEEEIARRNKRISELQDQLETASEKSDRESQPNYQ